jgi:tripartite-type tricarboxylate transporter receptor subunit TctC
MRQGKWMGGLALLLLITGATAGCSRPASYPNREIEFVIPFAPGGPADTASRIIQPRMGQLLEVPVVLMNKPGGGGALGADYAVKSPADGYHVFATTNNTLTILPATQPDLTYKPESFAPIGSYATDLSVIATKPGKPWKSFDQFVEYARKNPGKLTYGSAGTGTVSYFAMELLKQALGLDIVHVPFDGTAPARTALLGGHVDVSAGAFGSYGPLIRSGDLIPLVTSAPQRLADYPDVPTMAEKGSPQASLNIWAALFVPSATPKEVVDKLAGALEQTMKDPSVLKAFTDAGMVADYRNPEATRELLTSEAQAIRGAVAKIGNEK